MKSQYKRSIKTWAKYLLWIDTKNKCSLCGRELILPVGELASLTANQKAAWSSMKSSNRKNNHCGVISHIVSFKNLKYNKKYLKFILNEFIRTRKAKHNAFEKFIKEQYEKLPSSYFKGGEYTNSIIEDYLNKIILCYDCSLKIDGKSFDSIKNFKIFHSGFHLKIANEQINILLKIKKENMVINQKSLNFSNDQLLFNENKTSWIRFSTQDEFAFLESSISSLIGNIKMKNIKIQLEKEVFTRQNDDRVQEIIDLVSRIKDLEQFCAPKITKKIREILPKNYKSLKIKRSRNKSDIYTIKFRFLFLSATKHFITYLDIGSETELNLMTRKSFSTFTNELKDTKGYKEAVNSKWISSLKQTKINWESRQEYLSFRNLLIKQLDDFRELHESEGQKKFESFSIAYMARWELGKQQ